MKGKGLLLDSFPLVGFKLSIILDNIVVKFGDNIEWIQ